MHLHVGHAVDEDEVADGPLSEELELSATIRDGSEDGKGDGHYRGRSSLIVVAYAASIFISDAAPESIAVLNTSAEAGAAPGAYAA